ncbi:MAG: VanZ family protein [Mycobacteriales bacterium]
MDRHLAAARRWLPFCAAVVVSTLLIYAPGSHVPSSPHNADKLVHAAMFLVLALTGAWARIPRRWLGIGLVCYAAISEVLQAMLPIHRDGDWHDWLADSIGVVIGLLLAAWLIRRGAAPQPAASATPIRTSRSSRPPASKPRTAPSAAQPAPAKNASDTRSRS